MSDPTPDLPKTSGTKVYVLGCLGLTIFPFALMIAGFFLGIVLDPKSTPWNVGFFVWAALGIGCGVPALLAAIALAKGANARAPGVALGVLGGIVGLVTAAFGFAMSAMSFGHGRPLRKNGRAVTAPAAPSDAWSDDVRPALDSLDPALREALAAEWLEDARLEHASVAAFARLSLDLLAMGAPPALVDRCHRAAREEIAHARAAFALASAYAGKPIGPAAFPEAADSSSDQTRARLAVEALVDGCVGEGAAAASLAEAANACVDPAVAEVLRRAAREEADHAELSWDVLTWAVKQPDALREARRALDALTVPAETPPRWPAHVRTALAANGRLPAARERALRAEMIAVTRARFARA